MCTSAVTLISSNLFMKLDYPGCCAWLSPLLHISFLYFNMPNLLYTYTHTKSFSTFTSHSWHATASNTFQHLGSVTLISYFTLQSHLQVCVNKHTITEMLSFFSFLSCLFVFPAYALQKQQLPRTACPHNLNPSGNCAAHIVFLIWMIQNWFSS